MKKQKGEKAFANGQLDANTNILCYNCYDKLKKGAKVFKEDGTECKIKSKGTGKQARASIAKAKADKVTRHDEILQSLMDEPKAENDPTKTEFETISPMSGPGVLMVPKVGTVNGSRPKLLLAVPGGTLTSRTARSLSTPCRYGRAP